MKKNISVLINNKRLNAVEDFLYAGLSKTEKAKCRKNLKKLWLVLNMAYKEEEERRVLKTKPEKILKVKQARIHSKKIIRKSANKK